MTRVVATAVVLAVVVSGCEGSDDVDTANAHGDATVACTAEAQPRD